jgi:hypothetical protein
MLHFGNSKGGTVTMIVIDTAKEYNGQNCRSAYHTSGNLTNTHKDQ